MTREVFQHFATQYPTELVIFTHASREPRESVPFLSPLGLSQPAGQEEILEFPVQAASLPLSQWGSRRALQACPSLGGCIHFRFSRALRSPPGRTRSLNILLRWVRYSTHRSNTQSLSEQVQKRSVLSAAAIKSRLLWLLAPPPQHSPTHHEGPVIASSDQPLVLLFLAASLFQCPAVCAGRQSDRVWSFNSSWDHVQRHFDGNLQGLSGRSCCPKLSPYLPCVLLTSFCQEGTVLCLHHRHPPTDPWPEDVITSRVSLCAGNPTAPQEAGLAACCPL